MKPEVDGLDDLVRIAIRLARERGADVVDVPIGEIAAAAGMSRSTLVRRLRGTRRTLDEAVRAAGVDPGGQPVRERAVAAAAALIGERGLAAVTLEDVAAAAECSLPSLHLTFGGRDGLLAVVFERHMPLVDVENLLADPPGVEETVRTIHQTFAEAFSREPQVFPAILADVLARPDGPGRRLFQEQALPRLLGSLGVWLMTEVRTGRFRPLSLPILAHLLIGPMVTHILVRPTLAPLLGADLPTIEEVAETFTGAFLRAVVNDDAAGADGTGETGAP
ncbi:TetR/AcrR family transcriptional regulator [Actinomadura soli]|uniref:TetR/AcrR family transcriptional regulator n=1 Tax=Actinomadura soli TaxID=2508997 RepID=A0A5C4IZX2_9ACTN|nr:TetR/AcrR family transcriptional regulator [Actinomadura soli]TMQ89732.1 TetR/AcrR family transcriptional regulator [Actinomadura soli]